MLLYLHVALVEVLLLLTTLICQLQQDFVLDKLQLDCLDPVLNDSLPEAIHLHLRRGQAGSANHNMCLSRWLPAAIWFLIKQ